MPTGEEVGIKLVRGRACAAQPAARRNGRARSHFFQESVKSKHPQLLYESKLYKILQGGSAHAPAGRRDHGSPPPQPASPTSDGLAWRASTT